MPLTTPNIVLVITDDQEAETIDSQTMPYLLSEDHGNWVKFPNASHSQPLCYPSRSCLLTGQRSDHHGVDHNTGSPPVWDEDDSLGPWLQAAGYRTGLIGKYLNEFPWGSPYAPAGWDTLMATGTSTSYWNYNFYDETATQHPASSLTPRYMTDQLAALAVDFITDASTDPFFLYVAPIAPHTAFEPASRHLSASITTSDPAVFNPASMTGKPAWLAARPLLDGTAEAAARTNRDNARRTLLAVDEMIEDIFDALVTAGKLADTVFIYLTDNGAPFGRWRLPLTKNTPYRYCIDPKLRIRYPGATARSETELVTSIDLTATIVEMAGATATIDLDGVDLVPLIEETAGSWRESVEAHAGVDEIVPSWWWCRKGDWVYTEWLSGEVELYDLATDPDEETNVASSNTAKRDEMAAELAALRSPGGGGGDEVVGVGVSRWNGTGWRYGTMLRWTGSAWWRARVRRWNGSSWRKLTDA